MASGDYLDLAESAARAAQMDPADTAGDLARAKEKVNEAYLSTISDGSQWDFLQQEGEWLTDPDDDVYTYASIATAIGLSGAVIKDIITLVNDTDGIPMESMSWTALERATASSQDDDTSGSPTIWAKWATRIRLYPVPDSAYTLGMFCTLTPAAMSANSDTPLIPIQWRHRILVPYAAARLLEEEGGTEMIAQVDRLWARYNADFVRFRTAHATGRAPTLRLMSPTWGMDLPGGMDWAS